MCAARDKKPGFDSEFTGTVLKIKLRGEIDHHSAATLRSAIDDMIRTKRPAELVIDMSAVDFMDSSGLGLIMGRFNTVKSIGGNLTVSDPNEGTEKIMKLAGMERIVRITHSNQKNVGSDALKRMEAVAAMSVAHHTANESQRSTKKSENNKSKGEKS